MNKMILGAAGLLLSTSALAGVAMTKSDDAKLMPASVAATLLEPKAAIGLDDSMIHNAMLIDWNSKNAASTEPASFDVKAMDEPKLIQAQAVEEPFEQPVEQGAEPLPEPSAETMAVGSEAAAVDEAPVDSFAETGDGMSAPADDGMSAPVQTADASAAMLDLSPRQAAQNYPACSPGPGDDSCIQLYEPGVQTALASWSGQTGGFDNGQTGMGGPEEALDETSAVEPGYDEAAYEPLPEDAVMPADEDVASVDLPKSSDTLAI